MQNHNRYLHLKSVFGPWWICVNGIWTLISSADVIVSHWASGHFKSNWEAAWITPKWGWRAWGFGALLITLAFIYEYSYQYIKKCEREFAQERKGIDSTHAIIIREYSEKITGIEKELEEERAKQENPKLFLTYVAEDAKDFLSKSGLTVRNDGKKPAYKVILSCDLRDKMRLRFDDMPIQRIDPDKAVQLNLWTEYMDDNGKWHPGGGTPGGQVESCFEGLNNAVEPEKIFVTIKYSDYEGKEYSTSCVILRDGIMFLTKRIWCELVQAAGSAT